MRHWRWIVLAVVVAGLLLGPSSLESSAAAQPAIAWRDIPFVFVGSLGGMLFVVGIQLFRKDPRPSLWAIRLLGLASLWFAATGLSALAWASYHDGVVPHSALFAAVGVGSLLGVFFCWFIHERRFKHAL